MSRVYLIFSSVQHGNAITSISFLKGLQAWQKYRGLKDYLKCYDQEKRSDEAMQLVLAQQVINVGKRKEHIFTFSGSFLSFFWINGQLSSVLLFAKYFFRDLDVFMSTNNNRVFLLFLSLVSSIQFIFKLHFPWTLMCQALLFTAELFQSSLHPCGEY